MNPKVIEAALTAWYWLEKPEEHETAEDVEERMDAAIKAADAARAPEIIAAVERLEDAIAANAYGGVYELQNELAEEVNAARRDLFALLGIPEDGA